MARPIIETVSMRYEFTLEERASLGQELAKTRRSKMKIDEEEANQRAQIKTRRSELELRDGALCQMIGEGFEMRSIDCTLRWDDPNAGEVSYYRQDTGALLKTRAMTVPERQMDLPLQTEEQTKQNVVSFFKKGGEVVEGGKEESIEATGDAQPSTEDVDPHTAEEQAKEDTAAPAAPAPEKPSRSRGKKDVDKTEEPTVQ